LIVKHEQERGALAARGDIAAAEIRHDVKAGDLGEGIRIAVCQLKGIGKSVRWRSVCP